ncbi:MAG: UDP-glucose/GDP-mannose dehydrogenase family protein [Methanomicrobiales archaeon]|jgi:UDPglucose 6-dehydrogenase|nr:UDP-glucose/GDP-mannose dehydrogenase family protein [Methanomicrobiales archaeon]
MAIENKFRRIGVIGLGSVGKALKHALSFYHPCTGYDILGEYSWDDVLDTSAVFICVPTPEGGDGRLDCSIVESVLSKLSASRYAGIVVIKSTIGVGFMDEAVTEYPDLRLVYMPEFLRERSNFTWFVNPDRLVFSGNEEDVEEVLQYFTWVEDDVPVLRMTHREAELGKLAHNAYIALKVSFTNEIEQISHERSADPAHVMSVIWADRRVLSREHLRPGFGAYAGKCVPKDTRELINASECATLLQAAEDLNNWILVHEEAVPEKGAAALCEMNRNTA